MKWSDGQQGKRRSKFGRLLEQVAEHQHEHPGMFAEIARYDTLQVAADTAYRLRNKFPDFEVASRTDPDTREGVVIARFTAGEAAESE